MDRSHPLWEVYVIEGLADGRWAMLTKTHHATIDGASGVILLNMITDTDPDAPPIEPVPWSGEPVPSDTELLSLTARSLVANPVKGLRLQLRMVQDVAESFGVTSLTGLASAARGLVRQVTSTASAPDNERRVRIPITPAPPTPWNRNVSAHRRFAMRSTSLENIKRLKTATGGTVNDVVMAICTGALREYLLRHDALPDRPLRAMVPVSIRTGEEDDPWTNRVSAIIADLPTDCDDPVERVARCREAMAEAKRQFELVPAETLTDMTQTASPLVAVAAVRLMQRVRFADRVGFPFNVVISNVPGPRDPLYFAGAKLCHYIPVSTIADGVGLNITVHSYVDRLDFGLISCRNLVPDLWDLVDLHIAEIERLFEAAGAEWAEPQDVPSMRVGGSHSRPEPGKAARRAAAGSASGGRSTAKRSTGKRSTATRRRPAS
jgi:WS/DGAT/MGAT family acyltransferase